MVKFKDWEHAEKTIEKAKELGLAYDWEAVRESELANPCLEENGIGAVCIWFSSGKAGEFLQELCGVEGFYNETD